jgi:hypothetical protein
MHIEEQRALATNPTLPRARQDRLISRTLQGEELVYDLRARRGYGLNRTAALVWRQCDGQTTLEQMTATLRREVDPTGTPDVVALALRQLSVAGLLQEPWQPPAALPARSRRDLLRLGLVSSAAVLPVLATVLAPDARAEGLFSLPP